MFPFLSQRIPSKPKSSKEKNSCLFFSEPFLVISYTHIFLCIDSFTYSFLPHKNDLIRSNVISEASCLNQKPLLFEGFTSTAQIPVKLSGRGVELTVLKKAEKEDAWVFRVVETHGRSSHGSLFIEGSITECDLIEWSELSEPQNIRGEMPLYLKPFEIKTFKFKK